MNEILLIVDVLTAAATFLRLFLYRARGAQHTLGTSVFAYLLMAASATTVVRIVTGPYHVTPDVSEVILSAALCALVFRARGNVAQMLDSGVRHG